MLGSGQDSVKVVLVVRETVRGNTTQNPPNQTVENGNSRTKLCIHDSSMDFSIYYLTCKSHHHHPITYGQQWTSPGPFKFYTTQHLGGWSVRFPRKKFYVNVISVTRGWVPWVGVLHFQEKNITT